MGERRTRRTKVRSLYSSVIVRNDGVVVVGVSLGGVGVGGSRGDAVFFIVVSIIAIDDVRRRARWATASCIERREQ